LLSNCESRWNCNLCQTDFPFFIPFEDGDKIQIQTQFLDRFNADERSPTSGFGVSSSFIIAELIDPNGDLISNDYTQFSSRAMVAWNGEYSYQIIELDTSLIDEDCFYLRLTAYDAGGNTTQICTHDFSKGTCKDTIVIKGEYTGKDCLGNWYGEPVASQEDLIIYDNSLRYPGIFKSTGGSIEKNIFRGRSRSTRVIDSFEFSLHQMIPPFAEKYLRKVLLAGERVFFDGNAYLLENLVMENENTGNNMFLFSIEVQAECVINSKC